MWTISAYFTAIFVVTFGRISIYKAQSNIQENHFFFLFLPHMCKLMGVRSLCNALCLQCLPCLCPHNHLNSGKDLKMGTTGAYLAKAAFSQHLVEYQVVHGEVYPGSCRCSRGWAHALTCLAIVVCYKHTFAHTE